MISTGPPAKANVEDATSADAAARRVSFFILIISKVESIAVIFNIVTVLAKAIYTSNSYSRCSMVTTPRVLLIHWRDFRSFPLCSNQYSLVNWPADPVQDSLTCRVV